MSSASEPPGAEVAGRAGRRRFLLLWVVPAALVLAVVVAPLASGERTLFLRDVFNTHLEMKIAQARALEAGYLPLVDPWRAGGQPQLGNPNTGTLYPTSLLLLVASPLWTLNAHFWLHLLLAPWTMYWLGRSWGLGRRAAWVAGLSYAGGGYLLSTLNLHNLVAGAVWAPALAAAALDLVAGRRPRRSFAALGLVWAALILAGDPMTAVLALALAAAVATGGAVSARGLGARRPAKPSGIEPSAAGASSGGMGARGHPARRRGPVADGWVWRAVVALGLGTGLAAPQLVEFWRILPLSFRGYWRYSEGAATASSWHPASLAEWLVAFPFGRPDLSFWGEAIHGGAPPLLLSLAPGLLVMALLAAAGRPRGRAEKWAWIAAAAGVFFALGRHNPVVGWLLETVGLGLLRLPVKFWLWTAVAMALLAGLGFERLATERRARRRFLLALAALGAVVGLLWTLLALAPELAFAALRPLVPERFADAFVERERLRLAGSCLLSLTVLGALALVAVLGRRRPAALAALALVGLASQLFLLRPLYPTDSVAPYLRPPKVLDLVPSAEPYVQGDFGGLFGPAEIPYAAFPDASLRWLERQGHDELHPFAGVRFGRRVELALSPEGLDAFLTRATVQAVRGLPDPDRLRVLAASGVGTLLLRRPLAPAAAGLAELEAFLPSWGGTLRVYRLPERAEAVYFAGRVRRSAHLNEALAHIVDPRFDPRVEVVLPGPGPAHDGPGGRVEVVAAGPESVEVVVEADGPGALVVQRAHLPLWRAAVDGRPAAVTVANLHRMAVELPAGSHRVRLWIDRRPLRGGLVVAGAALVALLAIARRRPGSAGRAAAAS